MIKLFKKRSKLDKLNRQYTKLMAQANELSKISRARGDEKYFEADQVLKRIKELEANQA